MRVGQDGALLERIAVTAAEAEGQPVPNCVGHGIPVASHDEAVFVVADDLLELALGGGLRPAAASSNDSPAVRLVADREPGLRITSACPRDVPELPSTANDSHQQQPASMKLAQPSSPRATHGYTLVMRSPSLYVLRALTGRPKLARDSDALGMPDTRPS